MVVLPMPGMSSIRRWPRLSRQHSASRIWSRWVSSIRISRSTTSGSRYSQLNGSLVATSDYVDNTVTNGTTYYYVVTAVDAAAQESGYSNEASATPQASGGPTTMHVSSIVLSTVNAGQGKKRGRAEVTIVDDLGAVLEVAGETERALEAFTELYGEAAGYRDVAARLQRLRAHAGQRGGAPDVSGEE